MRSAVALAGVDSVPAWLRLLLLRLTSRWFDPGVATVQQDATDVAVAKAQRRRNRADAAIEAYRAVGTARRK